MALVPPGAVTVTSTVPAPGGLMTVSELSEETVRLVPAVAPNATAVAPVKPDPETVTDVPPEERPLPGLTPVTADAGVLAKAVPVRSAIVGEEIVGEEMVVNEAAVQLAEAPLWGETGAQLLPYQRRRGAVPESQLSTVNTVKLLPGCTATSKNEVAGEKPPDRRRRGSAGVGGERDGARPGGGHGESAAVAGGQRGLRRHSRACRT
ncbi:MAG: hypothetical protein NVS3B21_12210 [Acidimicrobiales bacterium]